MRIWSWSRSGNCTKRCNKLRTNLHCTLCNIQHWTRHVSTTDKSWESSNLLQCPTHPHCGTHHNVQKRNAFCIQRSPGICSCSSMSAHLSFIHPSKHCLGNHASPSNGKLSSLPEFGIKLLAPELESGSPEPGAPAIGNVKGESWVSVSCEPRFAASLLEAVSMAASSTNQASQWKWKGSHHHLQSSFHRVPETSTNIASLDENFPGLQGAHSSVVKSKRCHQWPKPCCREDASCQCQLDSCCRWWHWTTWLLNLPPILGATNPAAKMA